MRIGLISDTHGLLRPEALAALAGVEEIIHAGDIGAPEILERLRSLAPVHAVRGNNDRGPWGHGLPERLVLQRGAFRVQVLHDVKSLTVEAADAGCQVIVCGHSHRPAITRRGGALLVNPGSAGPRRFKLPVTIGYLSLTADSASAQIRHLL